MTIGHSAGIQGQTFLCRDMDRAEGFLAGLLGLRRVKSTVHPYDARLRVSHFGFREGSNGVAGSEVVSYIEWNPVFYAVPAAGLADPDATRTALDGLAVGDFKGRWGGGTNHHLALHTTSREQLLQWKRYLSDAGVHVTGPYFRNYFHAIYFRDPDGAIYEIATTEPGFAYDEEVLGSSHQAPPDEALAGTRSEEAVSAETWPEPVPSITPEMTLLGFHHNTSVSTDIDRTTDFFVESVGLDLIKRTDYLDQAGGTHYYYSAKAEPSPGAILTFFGFPGFEGGRLGVGLSHHISLLAAGDDALGQWREHLQQSGIEVSEVEDWTYYKAVTFRDPDGHILQIATAPDFTIDEPAESLGQSLALPERLEGQREAKGRFHRLRPAPKPAGVDA